LFLRKFYIGAAYEISDLLEAVDAVEYKILETGEKFSEFKILPESSWAKVIIDGFEKRVKTYASYDFSRNLISPVDIYKQYGNTNENIRYSNLSAAIKRTNLIPYKINGQLIGYEAHSVLELANYIENDYQTRYDFGVSPESEWPTVQIQSRIFKLKTFKSAESETIISTTSSAFDPNDQKRDAKSTRLAKLLKKNGIVSYKLPYNELGYKYTELVKLANQVESDFDIYERIVLNSESQWPTFTKQKTEKHAIPTYTNENGVIVASMASFYKSSGEEKKRHTLLQSLLTKANVQKYEIDGHKVGYEINSILEFANKIEAEYTEYTEFELADHSNWLEIDRNDAVEKIETFRSKSDGMLVSSISSIFKKSRGEESQYIKFNEIMKNYGYEKYNIDNRKRGYDINLIMRHISEV
jgi:hypothetical protein